MEINLILRAAFASRRLRAHEIDAVELHRARLWDVRRRIIRQSSTAAIPILR